MNWFRKKKEKEQPPPLIEVNIIDEWKENENTFSIYFTVDEHQRPGMIVNNEASTFYESGYIRALYRRICYLNDTIKQLGIKNDT